jgi:hypothetical protein
MDFPPSTWFEESVGRAPFVKHAAFGGFSARSG